MSVLLLALFLCVVATPVEAVAAGSSQQDNAALRQLLAIFQGFGRDTTLGQLHEIAGPRPEGMTLSDLAQVAIGGGLEARVVKIGVDRMESVSLPLIARLWDDRLMTVESAGNGAFLCSGDGAVWEPISGRQFEGIYTGWSLLVAQDEGLFREYDSHGPQIAFDHHTFSFRQIDEGSEVRHAFEFTNAGTSELIISDAHADCGCTTAVVMDGRVPPGGTSAILVTFDSTGQLGLRSYEISVSSNDAVTPLARLELGGVVLPGRVLVSPPAVGFSRVERGRSASREVYLFDPGYETLEVTDATSDSPFLDAEVECMGRDGGFPRYRATLTLDAGAPIGELKCMVTIRTNHPKDPEIGIPVTAAIRGEVSFRPDLLSLGIVRSGQQGEARVIVSSTGAEPLKIQSVSSPLDYVSVEVAELADDREYLFTARLDPTAPAGPIDAEIVICTNKRDQPQIRIPLRGFIDD